MASQENDTDLLPGDIVHTAEESVPTPEPEPERNEEELKNALDEARKSYVSARQDSLKFAGAKRVLGIFGGKRNAAEQELLAARDRYQKARENYVAKRVDAFIEEKGKLADEAINQAKENVKHPSFGEKIYSAYKKLGEINLLKAYEKIRGKQVEGKVKKAILRSLSLRTAVGYGLLGVAAATGGSLVGLGAFSAKRVWSGVSSSMGTYAGLEALHSRDVLKKPSEKEMEKLKADEGLLLGKINEMEAWAEFHHEPISENETYKNLRETYKSKIGERGNVVSEQINGLMRQSDEALEGKLKNHTWRRESRKALAGLVGVVVASGAIGKAIRGGWDYMTDKPKPNVAEIVSDRPTQGVSPSEPMHEPPSEQAWTNVIRNDELGAGHHDSAWYSTKQLFAQHSELQEKFPLRPGETPDHWAERMTANAVQYTEERGTNVPSLTHEGDAVHLKLAPDGKHFEIDVKADSGYATGELPERVEGGGGGHAETTQEMDAETQTSSESVAQENVVSQQHLEQDAMTAKKFYQYNSDIDKVITQAQANEGRYDLSSLQNALDNDLGIKLNSSEDAGSFMHYLGEDRGAILSDPTATERSYEEFVNHARENVYNIGKLLPKNKGAELLIAYQKDDVEHFGFARKISGGFFAKERWGFDLDGDGIIDGPKMSKKEILGSLVESKEELGQMGGDMGGKAQEGLEIDMLGVGDKQIAQNINNMLSDPDKITQLDLPTVAKLKELGQYKEIIKGLSDSDPKKELALENAGKIIEDLNSARPGLLKK